LSQVKKREPGQYRKVNALVFLKVGMYPGKRKRKLPAQRKGLPEDVNMTIGSALAGKFPLTPLSMAESRGTI
jgi:hypothetical protein